MLNTSRQSALVRNASDALVHLFYTMCSYVNVYHVSLWGHWVIFNMIFIAG